MGLCSEVADGGENLEDHPTLASRYVCRKAPFQRANCPANSSPGGVEPFSLRPDKILPGTLHHSGNRPAPPSDHTPLARRSAFQPGRSGPAREFERACGVRAHTARGFLPCRRAAKCIYRQMEYGTLWFRSRYREGVREISMNHKGVEYTLTRSETPGFWQWQFRIGDIVRSGKTEAELALLGHAPRRVKDRSRAEARSAPADVLIGVRAGTPGPLYAPSQASNRRRSSLI